MQGRRLLGSMRALASLLLAATLGAAPALAQSESFSSPRLFAAPILTLDQERLFVESLYGQRLQAEFEETSRELADRNRQITAELTAEEKALTEERKSLSAEEFRALADAFDEKVTQLRAGQDARIRILQRRREQERRDFNARIAPILTEMVLEAGAVAILDERAVILSADQIDITDRAITRIDTLLGDGGSLDPAPQSPDPNAPPDPDVPAPALPAGD